MDNLGFVWEIPYVPNQPSKLEDAVKKAELPETPDGLIYEDCCARVEKIDGKSVVTRYPIRIPLQYTR